MIAAQWNVTNFEPDYAGIFNALVFDASQPATKRDQLLKFCDNMGMPEDERSALYADVLRAKVDNA